MHRQNESVRSTVIYGGAKVENTLQLLRVFDFAVAFGVCSDVLHFRATVVIQSATPE